MCAFVHACMPACMHVCMHVCMCVPVFLSACMRSQADLEEHAERPASRLLPGAVRAPSSLPRRGRAPPHRHRLLPHHRLLLLRRPAAHRLGVRPRQGRSRSLVAGIERFSKSPQRSVLINGIFVTVCSSGSHAKMMK